MKPLSLEDVRQAVDGQWLTPSDAAAAVSGSRGFVTVVSIDSRTVAVCVMSFRVRLLTAAPPGNRAQARPLTPR